MLATSAFQVDAPALLGLPDLAHDLGGAEQHEGPPQEEHNACCVMLSGQPADSAYTGEMNTSGSTSYI